MKRITNMQIIHVSYLRVGIDGWHDVVVVDPHPIMSHGWRRSIPQRNCQNVLPQESDRSRKLLLKTGKIGLSGFVNSDGSQGYRRHLTRELLLRPSDIWIEDRQEP
jgi:hypothetical protein